MKNTQKGFIVPLLIAIIVVLAIGGGVYYYTQNKSQPITQQQVVDDQTASTSTNKISTTSTVVKNSANQSITLLSPNGGETWTVGNQYTITWNSNNVDSSLPIIITLTDYSKNGIYGNGVYINTKGVKVGDGKFTFTLNNASISTAIPNYSLAVSDKYKIKVYTLLGAQGPVVQGESKNYFNIVSSTQIVPPIVPSTQPSIKVTSPNGGETLRIGQSTTITWNTTGFSPSDTVYISLDDSSQYCPPAPSAGCWTSFIVGGYSLKNTGSYTWNTNTYSGDPGPNVPFYLSQRVSAGAVYKISLVIVGSNGARSTDSSNNYFTISK